MMAQPIECTAVDMESSAIQQFVSTEGNYVSTMQIFPRVSTSSLLQLMEWVQTRGRMRSNKAMIGRNNLRGIVGALKKGEAVWFAPDQDYGRKGSSFAPFFAVENVATTNGTYVLSRLSGAAMLTVTMVRKADYSGYRLFITPEMEGYPTDENQAAAYMNKIIEKEIMRAPEQYLWIHRRFKTRPVGESSLYI